MWEADAALWAAFVTVLAPDGRVVGGGVYTRLGSAEAPPVLLTCAHVVNLALGLDEGSASRPESVVRLVFPGVPGATVRARVVQWWPKLLAEAGSASVCRSHDRWTGDLAVLEALDPLPDSVRPVPMAVPELGDDLWAWRGNGDPRTVVSLRVDAAADEWLVLRAGPTGFAVQPGYSGGPLWCRRRAAVVGLVVAAHGRTAFPDMTTATPARQSYGIRGDVVLRRLAGVGAEEGLDPRVETLLVAQRNAARAFPYRSVALHRDDLTQVYVRQQISERRQRNGPEQPLRRRESAGGEHLPRRVEEFLALRRHVLLVGPPGSGKSTLSLQLSAGAVLLPGEEATGAAEVLVPVRVAARELAARPEVDLTAAVSALARRSALAFAQFDIGERLCVVPSLRAGVTWLLVVDGLDEVADVHARAELSDRLHAFLDAGTGHRVLVTTRPLPPREHVRWEQRGDVARCEIEPFEREQRSHFAHQWFGDPVVAEEFIARIVSSRMADLVSVPLLATVAAVVFEEGKAGALPHTAFAMYQHFVSHLYEYRAEQILADLRGRLAGVLDGEQLAARLVAGRIDVLEHVATAWLAGAELLPTAIECVRAAGMEPYPRPGDWAGTVTALLTSTGLVTHDGTGLGFIHRSFAEHLAAAAEARMLPTRFDPDDPLWWRALHGALNDFAAKDRDAVLHRALLSDADGLLDWLLAGNNAARELAARLVFEGVPSRPEHHAALAEALGYWSASRRHQDMLIRVLDTVSLAPALVLDVVESLVDSTHCALEVRDASIRALLRNGERVGAAARALLAIVDEQELPAAKRLWAAEMLMDLGEEPRTVARDRLLRMERQHDWVPGPQRKRAHELVLEIDARASGRGGPLATDHGWGRSTLVLPPPRPARPSRSRRPSEQTLRATLPAFVNGPPFVDAGESTVAPSLGAAEGQARIDEGASVGGDRLDPRVWAALGMPRGRIPLGCDTQAVLRAALAALAAGSARSAFSWQAGHRSRPDEVFFQAIAARGYGPHAPDLSSELWYALAGWLCRHPGASVLTARALRPNPVATMASYTQPEAAALAAAVVHAGTEGAQTGYALLALLASPKGAYQHCAQALSLLASAVRAAPDGFTSQAAAPVLACLYQGLYEATVPDEFVRAAQAVGSHRVAAHILAGDNHPEEAVTALLRLGSEHDKDALELLTGQISRFPQGIEAWCDAARLLLRQPGQTNATVRVLLDAVEAAPATRIC